MDISCKMAREVLSNKLTFEERPEVSLRARTVIFLKEEHFRQRQQKVPKT